MRGKPHRPKERGGTPGITPADAGKTARHGVDEVRPSDHPRGCGENPHGDAFMLQYGGSPPRMRGKLVSSELTSTEIRITPADAGKTPPQEPSFMEQWDHPRGCGENMTED